jgi:hypothetical protein
MKRRAVLYAVLFMAMALALPAPTVITVEGDFMMGREITGVALPQTGGIWTIAEGQSLTGQVVSVTTLAKHGLEGLKNGDRVTMSWLGENRFKLMHAASGKSVEIVFPKDKVRIRKIEK